MKLDARHRWRRLGWAFVDSLEWLVFAVLLFMVVVLWRAWMWPI